MFNNVGKKIMTLANVLAVLDIIGAIIIAIAGASSAGFIGFVVGAVAGVFSVIMCWPLYAFGQLVDDVHAMKTNNPDKTNVPVFTDDIPEL